MANKNRTLIKLDDKLIEITQGEKGLQAKELNADEVFEVSILDEGVEKLIENDINKLTNEAYKELQQSFKNTLKENVLKLAGFDNHWGHGWEVDHCNGRNSMISQYISSKVQQMITAEIDKIITPADIQVMIKDTKKAVLKEVQRNFEHHFREESYAQTKAAAKDFVASAIKKSMTKYQKQVIEKAEIAFLGCPARDAEDSDESEE